MAAYTEAFTTCSLPTSQCEASPISTAGFLNLWQVPLFIYFLNCLKDSLSPVLGHIMGAGPSQLRAQLDVCSGSTALGCFCDELP